MNWNACFLRVAFHSRLEIFPPADFEFMSYWTSTPPTVFQTFTVLVVLFLRNPRVEMPGKEEIYGKSMLVDGTIKENLGVKMTVLKECVEGIRGHVAKLNA
ncbi:hypothetical protein B0A55_12039 [Friedmanniomyces simplex]|uniref:Uncharacterized protein n=1 Tax=Friedmanniomyces simplex TaxID=329884 RepID=A0A4U0VSB4_9PEZI|nr:hypothetical protein B0A55_12039 [Friedmanniomyces simplex]